MYLEEDTSMPKKECWLKRFFKKIKKVLNKVKE